MVTMPESSTFSIRSMMSANDPLPRTRSSREPDSSLGARLRKRRKEMGWTQTELAEQVGTSQAVIQKIENGKSLRPRILEELARALDVKPAWLMFGVEEAGELSDEAIELARAWARLKEPHRTAMREAILRIGINI
jgi:transcriptional regulator with XRE-family HTH domain